MKKLIGRILPLSLSVLLIFSAAGCGEKVTQSESWVDEETLALASKPTIQTYSACAA